jgi:hypothetical protein
MTLSTTTFSIIHKDNQHNDIQYDNKMPHSA